MSQMEEVVKTLQNILKEEHSKEQLKIQLQNAYELCKKVKEIERLENLDYYSEVEDEEEEYNGQDKGK